MRATTWLRRGLGPVSHDRPRASRRGPQHISRLARAKLSRTAVCENGSCGEEGPSEDKLSEHQIMGWRAGSAAGLQGKGSPNFFFFFHRCRRQGEIPNAEFTRRGKSNQ